MQHNYYATENIPKITKKPDQVYRFTCNGKYAYMLIPAIPDKDRIKKA